MRVQIYYMSATGNSLYVARNLAKRLPQTELVPLIGQLANKEIKTTATIVGVVFPIYAFTTPQPVKQFFQRVDMRSADYIFAVATRFCSAKVFLDIDKWMKPYGTSLNAGFSVQTPCTYLPLFPVPTQDESRALDEKMQAELDTIQTLVTNRQTHRPKDGIMMYLISRVIYPPAAAFMTKVRLPNMAKSFYVDANCTGCGLCEKVCLSGKIKMANGKPVWHDDTACYYCLSCLHYCPAEAIQIKGRHTSSKGRYHHIEAKADDIASQKSDKV